MNEQTKTNVCTKNTNVIESILKHPIAFGMVTPSILSGIQCLRNGKMTPYFNVTINGKSKDTNKSEENA